tara:strand:- start:3359 stop:4225 length:867 start_codon:yes stop_codon:yes gene_type:complete
MTVKQILTHPGSAHKDDFMACSVLIHQHQVDVVRREPSQSDLDDSGILVVDVGGSHDPELGNFDHHQFPRDHPPICALSLVLQHLGVYEDALKFCDWLEPAEWFDSRGPSETAEWLGVERDLLSKLNSPVDLTLLRRFALTSRLTQDQPLWHIMRYIGEDLLSYLTLLRQRLEFIAENSEFWTVSTENSEFEVLFMPRTEPVPDDSSLGLQRYIDETGKSESVAAMIYPDRRGSGYGISRYNGNKQLDFSQLTECEDVHFAHIRGFVAKTTATEPERLRELLQLAVVE